MKKIYRAFCKFEEVLAMCLLGGLAALVWTVPWLLFNTAVGKFVFLALPFLALYNGEYGNPPKWAKTAYRIFYPAHLLVLGLLAAVLIR